MLRGSISKCIKYEKDHIGSIYCAGFTDMICKGTTHIRELRKTTLG